MGQNFKIWYLMKIGLKGRSNIIYDCGLTQKTRDSNLTCYALKIKSYDNLNSWLVIFFM